MVEAEALEKYKIIQGNIKRSKVLILEYRDNLILAVVELKKKVKKKNDIEIHEALVPRKCI